MRLLAIFCLCGGLAGCGPRYHIRTIEEPAPNATAESRKNAITTSRATPEKAVSGGTLVYSVEEGDTLSSIAKEQLGHRMLWRHLMEWNKRREGPSDLLAKGELIEIPPGIRGILGESGLAAKSKITTTPAPRIITPPEAVMVPPSRVFNVGEVLKFKVKWYFITAGHATMAVESLAPYDGVPCYKFLSRATSRLVFFFKVNDWAESYSTSDTLVSKRFEKHLREGRYKKDLVATFDHAKGVSTWDGKVGPLGPGCRDILAAFYYFRTMPLPPVGGEKTICVNNNGKNYELVTSVLRREIIRVPAGEFRTVLIRPRMKFEGLFRQRGDIYIWLTDDIKRIPVLVRSKVFLIGSVNIALTDIDPGGGSRSIEPSKDN